MFSLKSARSEDRTALEEAGHFVARDEIFAIVTRLGPKIDWKNPPEAWQKVLLKVFGRNVFPRLGLRTIRRVLRRLRTRVSFPRKARRSALGLQVSPAQVKTFSMRTFTVEDLAQTTRKLFRVSVWAAGLEIKGGNLVGKREFYRKGFRTVGKLRVENADLRPERESPRTGQDP